MRVLPRSFLVGLAAVLALAAAPLTAHGQPDASRARDAGTDPQGEARAAMREGLAAVELNDHETALRQFRRATELVPEANLPHRHAARSLEELRRWEEAITEYEAYLRIKADVSDAQAVRDRIAEIRRTHLSGTVTLACEPKPTAVTVDGSAVTLGPANDVVLPKGTHRIRVQAPDFVPREIEVNVPAEGSVSPECTMTRMSVIAPPASSSPNIAVGQGPPQREQPTTTPWYGRWYTWAGAGAIVAGVVVATILIASGGGAPPASEGGNHSFP